MHKIVITEGNFLVNLLQNQVTNLHSFPKFILFSPWIGHRIVEVLQKDRDCYPSFYSQFLCLSSDIIETVLVNPLFIFLRLQGPSDCPFVIILCVLSCPQPHPRNDTSYPDSSLGGEDDWVEFHSNRLRPGPAMAHIYPNQVSCIELHRLKGGKWQNSLHSLVKGMGNFLKSLQGLEEGGVVIHFYLGNISEFGGGGL